MIKQFVKTKSTNVFDIVKRFKSDESGATSIEYGLIAGLISVLLITGASALGGSVNRLYAEVDLLLSGPPERATSNVTFGG